MPRSSRSHSEWADMGAGVVALRCDSGQSAGVGHLMRALSLAEELKARHVGTVLIGDVSEPVWARRLVRDLDVPVVPRPGCAEELVRLLDRDRVDALVIDSYTEAPETAPAVRSSGRVVALIVDGDLRNQQADIVVDQNLGAEANPHYVGRHARLLLGLDYVLLRDVVRTRRPVAPRSDPSPGVPRVLAFFGGTDAAAAAEITTPIILGTGLPLTCTVVAHDPGTAQRLRALPWAPSQDVHVIPPTPDIPALAAGSDLVVSASGTSTWELLCLGAPTALVWVVENQRIGYEATTRSGLTVGLGELARLAGDAAARDHASELLGLTLRDPHVQARLSARGWRSVDGGGRERVVDALLETVARRGT